MATSRSDDQGSFRHLVAIDDCGSVVAVGRRLRSPCDLGGSLIGVGWPVWYR